MDGVLLARAFERNLRLVQMQTDGVSHDDSLAQSEYNINCLNWVVGHIVQSRDVVLEMLGAAAVLTPGQSARYEAESNPVTEDGPGVVRLEDLMAAMDEQQQRMADLMSDMTAADLAVTRKAGDRETPLIRLIHFRYFHDTYHVGQTDLLRQISGKSDKVI